MKKSVAKKEVDARIDDALYSASNLLNYLLKTRATLHTMKEVYMAMASLQDAKRCASHLEHILSTAENAIMSTLPKRPVRPTGLKVTIKDLVRFDPQYFSYFEPGVTRGFSKDNLMRHLTTWAFLDGDTRSALKEVRVSFGKKVWAGVCEKLRTRDHDT